MKIQHLVALFAAAVTFTACDDTTDTIGASLSNLTDAVEVGTASFDIPSNSILADSVLSNSLTGYIGKVRDPETGAYITGDFMAQFTCLEDYQFPDKNNLYGRNANGKLEAGLVNADSCELRLFYRGFYGDSTRTMKMKAMEMSQTMNEDRSYYSSFDPLEQGLVRKDGAQATKVYSLIDYNLPQNVRDSSNYTPYITIKFNQPYTDKNGKVYSNYGTYVLETYYEHPEYFKNAYTFRNHVVPGFFFKNVGGLGNMAYISDSQLNVYYHQKDQYTKTDSVNGEPVTVKKDTIFQNVTSFWGTEEVLQTTTITNDKSTLEKLVADQSCTYLKTPAGIYTEMTLPVDDITKGHENDIVTSAQLVVPRLNNTSTSEYAFDAPQKVLLIPKDSIRSFFENNDIDNNKTAYITSWTNSGDNSYIFSNIASLVTAMKNVDKAKRSTNWNKIVLIPVEVSTTSTYSSYTGQTSTVTTKVANDMSLTSTRLAKGTSQNSPIKLSVIYSRFK